MATAPATSLEYIGQPDIDRNFRALHEQLAQIGRLVPYYGTGSPNGAVPGNIGDVFRRTDGGAGTSFYVKESGAAGSNTGWVAK